MKAPGSIASGGFCTDSRKNENVAKGNLSDYHVIARRAKPDVAIRSLLERFVIKERKGMRIATPVCGLARNDIFS